MKKGIKEKIPVMITSLIQLVILLRDFIIPEQLVEAKYVEELKSSAGFGIFILVMMFLTILWDEIKYTKKYLIAWNVFLFLSVPNTLARIISVISILILAFVKYERKEKINMKEACKILEVNNEKWTKKKWILLIIFALIYFGQNFIPDKWIAELSPVGVIIFVIGLHIGLLMFAIVTFFKEIKEGTKIIAKNFRLTIKYMLKLFVKMVIVMAIVTVISVLITNKETSVNQENIESLPMYITIPLAVLWAPFVEETIFRGGFRKIIKHKLLFIIISGAVFGMLHAIEEATFIAALATSLPYAVIGMVFAYSYARTNNLAVNILFHMLYNALAVLASMLK